jgi:hypothetical protein
MPELRAEAWKKFRARLSFFREAGVCGVDIFFFLFLSQVCVCMISWMDIEVNADEQPALGDEQPALGGEQPALDGEQPALGGDGQPAQGGDDAVIEPLADEDINALALIAHEEGLFVVLGDDEDDEDEGEDEEEEEGWEEDEFPNDMRTFWKAHLVKRRPHSNEAKSAHVLEYCTQAVMQAFGAYEGNVDYTMDDLKRDSEHFLTWFRFTLFEVVWLARVILLDLQSGLVPTSALQADDTIFTEFKVHGATARQRPTTSALECVMLTLNKLSVSVRYVTMTSNFGKNKTNLQQLVEFGMDMFMHGTLSRAHDREYLWPRDAALIQQMKQGLIDRGCPFHNCIGYIDGFFLPIARPSPGPDGEDVQRAFWSGYKKSHGFNNATIISADGINFYPAVGFPGANNDIHVLNNCGFIDYAYQQEYEGGDLDGQLQHDVDTQQFDFTIVGDKIYPTQGNHPVHGMYSTPPGGIAFQPVEEKKANAAASIGRVTVEWNVQKLKDPSKQLVTSAMMMTGKTNVIRNIFVAVGIANLKVLLRGESQISRYFNVEVRSMNSIWGDVVGMPMYPTDEMDVWVGDANPDINNE